MKTFKCYIITYTIILIAPIIVHMKNGDSFAWGIIASLHAPLIIKEGINPKALLGAGFVALVV